MKKNNLLNSCAILLFLPGAFLIYSGVKDGIPPPSVTGAGFIIIAFVFPGLRNKK